MRFTENEIKRRQKKREIIPLWSGYKKIIKRNNIKKQKYSYNKKVQMIISSSYDNKTINVILVSLSSFAIVIEGKSIIG